MTQLSDLIWLYIYSVLTPTMASSDRMLFRSSAVSLLPRIQNGLSQTELVHVPHPFWPLRTSTPRLQHARPLRISVLDASFNPPTLAHLALVNAARPSYPRDLNAEGRLDDDDNRDYDAHLLLLSVRNADKSLKPTDATYIQRLEMMHLLAQQVQPSSRTTEPNVAVGIINEPTFIGKSTRLLDFLSTHVQTLSQAYPESIPLSESERIRFELSFILGLDTLERLVSPRYYPSEAAMLTSLRRFFSPSEENSLVVCARRKSSGGDALGGKDKLALAREFIDARRVCMIDIGEDESTYSSTTVRTAIGGKGLGEEGQKAWRRYVPSTVADYIVEQKLYVA
ncbi:Nucleotidylyl transferase [Macrolepiota fuliginosa MF-IS2]|uniref:Nucleotidylyl transferase n=1 Tax=Macrolepiota fuliginosa MF-IS2 TaxID=1400762 RepID=A0A9P6C4R3_9AGAR|nr:Nucleotidylyl transferase [Macrolepiota fuliginosa MF-IS2]